MGLGKREMLLDRDGLEIERQLDDIAEAADALFQSDASCGDPSCGDKCSIYDDAWWGCDVEDEETYRPIFEGPNRKRWAMCRTCGNDEPRRCSRWDAWACDVCNVWLEPTVCSDPTCEFCVDRPPRPR